MFVCCSLSVRTTLVFEYFTTPTDNYLRASPEDCLPPHKDNIILSGSFIKAPESTNSPDLSYFNIRWYISLTFQWEEKSDGDIRLQKHLFRSLVSGTHLL